MLCITVKLSEHDLSHEIRDVGQRREVGGIPASRNISAVYIEATAMRTYQVTVYWLPGTHTVEAVGLVIFGSITSLGAIGTANAVASREKDAKIVENSMTGGVQRGQGHCRRRARWWWMTEKEPQKTNHDGQLSWVFVPFPKDLASILFVGKSLMGDLRPACLADGRITGRCWRQAQCLPSNSLHSSHGRVRDLVSSELYSKA